MTSPRSDDDYAEMIRRYQAGETLHALGAAFGLQYQSVRKGFLRRHIKLRPPFADYRLPCNHAFFDTPTSTSSYWAGFIMADGSVGQDHLSLCAAQPDAGHIRQFVNDVGYGGTISTRANVPSPYSGAPTLPITRVAIHSRQMISALNGFGVVPRKSLIAAILDDRLLFDRDFWRGVVDGDGTLGWHPGNDRGYRYPYLQLCSGSLTLLNQFREFVRYHISDCNTRIHKSKTIWIYRLAGMRAKRMAEILYSDAIAALPRKAKTASDFCGFAIPSRDHGGTLS